MFPVTITVTNQAELNAIMAALNLGSSDPSTGRGPAHTAPQVPAEKKPKAQADTSATTPDAPVGTQPTASAPAAAAPESEAANSDAAQGGNSEEGAWNTQDGYKDTAEYQAVAKAVVEVAKAKGREAAAALLEKVAGVKSLPESLPSQADAIVAAFEEAKGA
ncbi:hypothetical protein ABS755_07225 [Castellaniella sp. FW104-16D08]|uniref:hypothetical protein n=1 Tax=unclassified Castellaniella TaxID=2617606 RepID=UPI003314FDDA